MTDSDRAAYQDVRHELLASLHLDRPGEWWHQEGRRRGAIRPDGTLDRAKLSTWLDELVKARVG